MKAFLAVSLMAASLGFCQDSPRPSRDRAATEAEIALKRKQEAYSSLAKAIELETAGEWVKARAEYAEALLREPDNADARAGKERVSAPIVAWLQYQRLIESAEGLASAGAFQASMRRFNEAMRLRPSGEAPHERVTKLRALLMEQNTPVEVTIKSDTKTWVTITNFKGPKQIETETIKMLPGDYRVVGRREGYRDVVENLSVRAGQAQPTLTIVCTWLAPGSSVASDSEKEGQRMMREYQVELAKARADEAKANAYFAEDIENIRRSYIPDVQPVSGGKAKK